MFIEAVFLYAAQPECPKGNCNPVQQPTAAVVTVERPAKSITLPPRPNNGGRRPRKSLFHSKPAATQMNYIYICPNGACK
jgi:hypothetical protein